jgi:hypothetical protein
MGLLDDAIREHLELKRLRGADPGEVAREQREALDPVPRRGEEQPEDGHSLAEDQPSGEAVPEGLGGEGRQDAASASNVAETKSDVDDPTSEEHPHEVGLARDADFSNVGQETAELDMRTVLDEASHGPGLQAPADPEGAVAGLMGKGSAAQTEEPPGEESLEWEVPASSSHEHVQGGGPTRADGSDGGAVGAGEASSEAEGAAEDVLEETPDFLRDTPEQERLWFEQRPPRDFDFDK